MKKDNWRFEALARAKIVRQEIELKNTLEAVNVLNCTEEEYIGGEEYGNKRRGEKWRDTH